ncbi:MAG TPA: response regulator [Candidatus Acidoferrales bacterium]|nr:response regulator [Candidatus Acidoferrales bacterium]
MSNPDDPSSASPAAARILLVDDDPMITELVVDMLGMEGYEVDTATNGIEALQKLESQRYDLIITDLHMPKLDGSGFYRELSQRKVHSLKRIIFLTGTTGVSEEHRLVQESGVPVLLKPFNVVELIELVRRLLSGAP